MLTVRLCHGSVGMSEDHLLKYIRIEQLYARSALWTLRTSVLVSYVCLEGHGYSWMAQSFLKMSPLSFQNYASEKKSETTVELSSVSSCPLTRESTTNIKFTKKIISHHIMSTKLFKILPIL